MSSILELFATPTDDPDVDWQHVTVAKYCPFLDRTCVKIRKTTPPVIIGTCSVRHTKGGDAGLLICPHRFLDRKQIFMDCIHLLTLHEPGNELHKVPELSIPGSNVDYVLASVRQGKVVDFVGIELQALDTTGSLWRERQRFLKSKGLDVEDDETQGTWGINWMMTAKTTLIQLLRKVETFEYLNKHFVLVLQEPLLADIQSKFSFRHIEAAKLGDSMHFHAYSLRQGDEYQYKLNLSRRLSTDAKGVAIAMGMEASPNVELAALLARIQAKISVNTLLTV